MIYRGSTGMDGVRVKRDKLLAQVDPMVMSDSPLGAGMRQAFVEYRQKLRDITKQELPVTWPDYPTEPVDLPEPEPSQPEVMMPPITYSARIEEYREDGETDLDLKRRIMREIDKKMNVIAESNASNKIRAEFETLHEMLYQLKDV